MPVYTIKYKYILVLLCKISNSLVALQLEKSQTSEICNAIINGIIKYFGTPFHK